MNLDSASEEGSVRVDLLGGTLDLAPINLILPNAVTINLATSLKARVDLSIDETLDKSLMIESQDYETVQSFDWDEAAKETGPLQFTLEIIQLFRSQLKDKKLRIILSSEAPAGSGLGGSSAMGITLFKALVKFFGENINGVDERKKAISQVHALEGKILDRGPAGYQDYYPALFGGILGLVPTPVGVEVEQYYDETFARSLEKRLSLISSGISRNSGLNNWQVYKDFFDRQNNVREGLSDIAKLSHQAREAISKKNVQQLIDLIGKEGEKREQLFSGIVCDEVKTFYNDLKKEISNAGLKVCGAGGGGCFLVTHGEGEKSRVHEMSKSHQMQPLDFNILPGQ